MQLKLVALFIAIAVLTVTLIRGGVPEKVVVIVLNALPKESVPMVWFRFTSLSEQNDTAPRCTAMVPVTVILPTMLVMLLTVKPVGNCVVTKVPALLTVRL